MGVEHIMHRLWLDAAALFHGQAFMLRACGLDVAAREATRNADWCRAQAERR